MEEIPENTKSKRKILVVIDTDPRSSARVAEAVRTAGGVRVWQQVEISVVLCGPAAAAVGEGAGQLSEGRMFKQFLPMVRENGGSVHLMPDPETMEGIDATELVENNLKEPALAELAVLDDAQFRSMFSGSPIKRIGRDRFVRNVLYAIGNSGQGRLRAVAQSLCADPDPAVVDAARWAVERLTK